MIMTNTIRKLFYQYFGRRFYENVNGTDFTKNCLLLYVLEPFRSKTVSVNHQSQWQAKELARIVGEFGFNVDVIHYADDTVRLTKSYDLIINLHPGLNRVYGNHTNSPCLKIAYITGSNPAFSNSAEAQRLEDLFARRGVRLQQRRYVKPFPKGEFESYDAMFFIGNSGNLKTYDEFNLKRVCFIRNTGFSYFRSEEYARKSPRNFLFLASGGQVHKGLDLLLEVFSRNRELNLYVCSSFKREKDFCRLYRQELFHSANIYPVGFIGIGSEKFQEICRVCSYVILPSCSEANAGSVLTAMAAGLIPLVSRECGFADDEVHYFENCAIDTISRAVVDFSIKDTAWIWEESRKSLRIVAERYSERNYSESVRAALNEVLSHGR